MPPCTRTLGRPAAAGDRQGGTRAVAVAVAVAGRRRRRTCTPPRCCRSCCSRRRRNTPWCVVWLFSWQSDGARTCRGAGSGRGVRRRRSLARRRTRTNATLSQLVELKNGETYNGHMVQCDSWMNVHLREVICTSKARDVRVSELRRFVSCVNFFSRLSSQAGRPVRRSARTQRARVTRNHNDVAAAFTRRRARTFKGHTHTAHACTRTRTHTQPHRHIHTQQHAEKQQHNNINNTQH